MTEVIRLKNISKSFGPVVANRQVSMTINKGEIRALVGENGAGKTTLMNILYGLYRPDEGQIFIRGEEKRYKSPLDAIEDGLGMVHQHFKLFSKLTVLENIIYGLEPSRLGFINRARARQIVQELSETYNLQVPLELKVKELPVGVRQRVEILKALYREAEILIFDEPTAVLTPQEQEQFFKVLRNLSSQGKTIIFITHKLNEVMEISDSISVMRMGEMSAYLETSHTDTREICRHMVGRDVLFDLEQGISKPGAAVLEVEDLTVYDLDNLPVVNGVSFQVQEGEIVGIAGVAGNGQTELIQALTGMIEKNRVFGEIRIEGKLASLLSVGQRREAGMAYIPEDRTRVGLALPATVSENLVMGYVENPPFSKGMLIQQKQMRDFSNQLVDKYLIKTNDIAETVSNLSGGNLQKVIVARELDHNSRLLIAEQPTRGIDVGSIEFIHRFILEHRDRGNAILLVSTELQEIMSLTDRILVMYEGEIVGELSRNEADRKKIGLWMAGVREVDEQT